VPRITHIEIQRIDVELNEPFGIATGAQPLAENLLVRVRAGGALGLGEAAPFPAVNGETRDLAERTIEAARAELTGLAVDDLEHVAEVTKRVLAAAPSARCAVETAVLDARLRAARRSMFDHFGGAEAELCTDITLTTGTPEHAEHSAARAAEGGFTVLKAKIGGVPPHVDVERLTRAARAAPGASFILDANASLSSDEALRLLDALGQLRERVLLFEQPTGKHDLAGLAAVRRAGVRVAADESASSPEDVARLVERGAADVINIKIMKCGLFDAVRMLDAARRAGLGLMIGGMVETRLAMSVSACLAGGRGGFSFFDLDTPLFMKNDPFSGGFAQVGPRLRLDHIREGHGVSEPASVLS
jgi:L-alanine-DL-glutamate epimerase-like enolase superfamily enzyme